MTNEQKEAARARMAKARAARMAKRQEGSVAVKEPSLIASVDIQPDLVLTVRRLHVGSFTGLWELAKVMPDGSIKVITDANTKAIVISLARNEILRCGQ